MGPKRIEVADAHAGAQTTDTLFQKPTPSNLPKQRYNLHSSSRGKIHKPRPVQRTRKSKRKDEISSELLAAVPSVDTMTDAIKALWLGGVEKRRNTQPSLPSRVLTSFLLVSDTHNIEPSAPRDGSSPFRKPFPRTDVFIHAGDLTNEGTFKALKRAVDWIAEIPAELKIVIAGNHDWRLDDNYWGAEGDGKESRRCREYLMSEGMRKKGIWYLEDEMREFTLSNGAKFTVLASPCTPRGSHPHNSGSFRYEPTAKNYWHRKFPLINLPEQVHIAVTHTPPHKMHDEVSPGQNVGCPELLRFLRDVRPLLSVCGHIHEAAGAKLVTWEKLDEKGDRTALAERDLRPEIKKIETPEGGIYSDLTGLTQELLEGEQTLFVNASIAGDGGRAGRSPVMVELVLPYTTA
ncbi:hypothetical protein TWF696_008037 [Orbilia brochopaga]|uniref:Calcineurin-like phosphoesterase domain-containing protein n=1 Tax=Orbilia brochopaga TaxID=3140254 RepID=A0AAV9UMC0_9PEZI